MERVRRYDWQDALIEAQARGILSNGALLLATKLSKAINWKPKEAGKPAGLYWKNEDALKNVSAGRATYYRYRQSLFETGFLTDERGNLVPLIPDLSQLETSASPSETQESAGETQMSHGETRESLVDKSFSVDTCSGIHAVTSLSESMPPASPAAGSSFDSSLDSSLNEGELSLTSSEPGSSLALSKDEWVEGAEEQAVIEVPLSQVEIRDEVDKEADWREEQAKGGPRYKAEDWTTIRELARGYVEKDGMEPGRAVGRAMIMTVEW